MKNSLILFILLFFSQIASGETLKVYKNEECTIYENPFSENKDISINTSDSIFLSGSVNNAIINALGRKIQNTNLIDISETIFDDSEEIKLDALCSSKTRLKEFRFPKNGFPRACSLNKTFQDCSQLTEIKNLDKIDSISTLAYTFEGCTSLESITFSKTKKKLSQSGSFERAFYKCVSLKEIESFDSFIIQNKMNSTFQYCSNLSVIKLGTVDGSVGSYDKTFNKCAAIVYIDYENSTIPDDWKTLKSQFVYPITSCSASPLLTNNIKSCDIIYNPISALNQETIFRIGETFETSKQIKIEDITIDDLKYNLWVGLKNESMNDYCYSEPTPIVFREKETMVTFTYYGTPYEYALDTLPTVLKRGSSVMNTFSSMKVSGIIDDFNILRLTNFMKAGNQFDVVDLSEAIIQAKFLDFSNLMSSNGTNTYYLKEFIFPNTIVNCPCDLTKTFYDCQSLKSVKNLDKLVSITSLKSTFYHTKIEELTFSEIPDTNNISLYEAFKYTSALKNINNLDRFSNITSLESAFYSTTCSHLYFSTTPNNNQLNLNNTFRNCSNLKSLDLRSFTNIEYIGNTFKGCKSLDTLKLGFNIETTKEVFDKDGYDHYSGEFFKDCPTSLFIYLPDSIKSLENTFDMDHYVLPITKTYINFASKDSFECQIIPYYVASQDTAWKCTLSSGDTIVKTLSDDLLSQCVKISCGLKNDAMNDYFWATPIYIQKAEGPYISLQKSLSSILDLAWKDTLSYIETYPLDSISGDILKDVYSIQLHGKFNDSTLSIVKSALKENLNLHFCDFSDSELDINQAMEDFFEDQFWLQSVIFPAGENNKPISLKGTFSGTTLLRELDLSYFANITNMHMALSSCGAHTVTFSSKENNNEVNFAQAFMGTSIDTLDLSIFSKISNLSHAFAHSTIRSLKFSEKENQLPVSMFQTFSGTDFYTNDIVNFDKFTNVSNYIATFQKANNLTFEKDTHLDTLRFGTDPNKIQTDSLTWTLANAARISVKYLPDGVDTLPSKWQNYRNFVVPMVANTTNWSSHSLLENILNMSEMSPSYAYIADTTRYLVRLEVLKEWLTAFGFSISSLKSGLKSGHTDEVESIIFDPETMSLEDYKDYALTCVVSNPKYKALAYAINVAELLKGDNQTDNAIELNTPNVYISVKDGIVTISHEDNHYIEIFNTLGISHFKGNTNGKDTCVELPSGVYFILCDGVLLKKAIVK